MYYWHWLRNIVRRPHTTGYPTNRDGVVVSMGNPDGIKEFSDEGLRGMSRRAVALRQVDSGSCNGCESELSLLSSPDYDLTRYGFSVAPSPKHADILVVTGVVTERMAPVVKAVYEQMTEPKRVVAIGVCAISGGVFREAPGVIGSLEGIVPVTIQIDGCPPTPGDILRGLLWAVDGKDPEAVQGVMA